MCVAFCDPSEKVGDVTWIVSLLLWFREHSGRELGGLRKIYVKSALVSDWLVNGKITPSSRPYANKRRGLNDCWPGVNQIVAYFKSWNFPTISSQHCNWFQDQIIFLFILWFFCSIFWWFRWNTTTCFWQPPPQPREWYKPLKNDVTLPVACVNLMNFLSSLNIKWSKNPSLWSLENQGTFSWSCSHECPVRIDRREYDWSLLQDEDEDEDSASVLEFAQPAEYVFEGGTDCLEAAASGRRGPSTRRKTTLSQRCCWS